MPDKALRILMVLHMPWSRDLGGSRVQLELAEEFQEMGCQVDKFDYRDAFPWQRKIHFFSPRLALATSLIGKSFRTHAAAFVRKNAHKYDIVDCHQGNLNKSKREMGFNGLLVARSVGLYAFYEKFAQEEESLFLPAIQRKKLSQKVLTVLRNLKFRDETGIYERSLRLADLINLPNEDERNYVSNQLGLREKSIVHSFGLSQSRMTAFGDARAPIVARHERQEVVFIGAWSARKGSRDWAAIVTQVKQAIPEVRFKFLGTGLNANIVLSDLGREPCDWITVIPRYLSEDLPALLRESKIGVFPSYIEGFGFAVLEKLAAGLPTVAYNVPGPRSILSDLHGRSLVPRGDSVALADTIIDTLRLPLNTYKEASVAATRRAQMFLWPRIAQDTLTSYRHALKTLREVSRPVFL